MHHLLVFFSSSSLLQLQRLRESRTKADLTPGCYLGIFPSYAWLPDGSTSPIPGDPFWSVPLSTNTLEPTRSHTHNHPPTRDIQTQNKSHLRLVCYRSEVMYYNALDCALATQQFQKSDQKSGRYQHCKQPAMIAPIATLPVWK